MKKIVGTRIEQTEKDQFKEKARKYKMNESLLLRFLIMAINKDDEALMPLIMEIIKKDHLSF